MLFIELNPDAICFTSFVNSSTDATISINIPCDSFTAAY